MRLLAYNIFEGCTDPDRYAKLVAFVRAQQPDILGLCECNGWDAHENALAKDFAELVSMPLTAVCLSNYGYHLALYSKLRCRNVQLVTSGLWHGAIVAQFDTFNLVLTHLSPMNEDTRISEVMRLDPYLRRSPVVLMGDLNCLAQSDLEDPAALLANLRKLGITTFGTDVVRTAVTDHLHENLHLIDTYRRFSNQILTTVPTPLNQDPKHKPGVRLDYIWISHDLNRTLTDARIHQNRQTDQISDHYPVSADLNL